MSKEYRMSIAVDASGASSGVDNVAKAFANLEKYLSSMDRTLTGIESALSNTGSVSSQLSSSLDSAAKSADSAQKGLKNAAKSADELANQSGQAAKTQKDLATAFEKVALAAGVAFTATSFAIKGPVTAAVDFEKSMAGVKKVIDFESPAQFKQMEQDIIALSQRLPMAAADIAAIMEAAGQSGIARDELPRFAESAIKMGVAFDITADQAGKAMAEMRASFGMSQTEVETLADQINYLGNNSTNSAPQIMEVVQRIGSLAETANISSATLAALSASMVGVAPEVAATSLKNFSLQLVKGESLSKSAMNAFKTMGLDYKQVAQDMKKDSEGTIRKVLEAAQKVPEYMRAAVLNDAFGSESIAAISQLVTNYETVDKNLKAMGDSATYAGSMLKEFEGMAGTSAAQMQLFDNNIQAVKIAFGAAFLPAINQVMTALTPVLKTIAQWVQENPKLASTIIAVSTGLLGLVAGLGAVVAILPTMAAGWALLSAGMAAVSLPMLGIVAGIAAVIAIGVSLYKNWDTIKAKASETWNGIKETVSNAWEGVKSLFSTDIFANIWNGIKSDASSAWESVKSTASSAFESVKSAIASSGVGDAFSKGFNNAKNAVSTAMSGIKSAVTAGVTAVKAMIQLHVTGFAIVFNTAFNTIKTVVQTSFGVIKGIVTGDIGAVKSAISNGLSQLAGIARNAISQMVAAFKSAGAQLRNVGGDIIQGLINGLKAKASAVVSAAREVASSAVSAFKSVFRTASPSRVTREIGEWVAEGLGVGIDAKAKQAVESAEKLANATVKAIDKPLNAKDAKKQAEKEAKDKQKEQEKQQKKAIKQLEDYKKALSDAEQALERDLFILSQKSLGNPFAELTADIKFGKYGTNDTTKLQQLAQEKLYSENTLAVNEEIKKVKDDIAKVGMTTSQLMQWEYENADKYLGVSKELFDELVQQTELLENKQRIYASEKKLTDEILKLDEQMLLAGKNEFEILQYQLAHAKEYQGVNEDIKNTYLERVKAAKQEADLVKSRQSLEKAVAIAKNPTDKYAGMRYDLQQHGFDQSTIDGIVSNQEKTDVATAFNDLRNQMGQSDDPFAKLEAENQRKLGIIQKARGLELATHAEYDEMEKQQQAEFLRAKNELALTQGEQMLGSLTSIAKDAFGEQSKAYKVMFAMEKGMAIARSIMAIQTALASASASAPFPANLGVMATVAAQTASIIGNIKAVTMPVGQAHDGIMSVPKSGTWNLEKGERVLPRHTAKALDDKLDGMGSGGVNITINVASDGSSTTDAQGANQTAKAMADRIKTVVLETLRQERKQGGLLYA